MTRNILFVMKGSSRITYFELVWGNFTPDQRFTIDTPIKVMGAVYTFSDELNCFFFKSEHLPSYRENYGYN